MTYGRPGVYLTETLLPAPITQGPTADAAGAVAAPFAQGPETLTLVTSWYDFTSKFGGYNALFPATFGVGQFFNNGGRELYVQRILHSDATAATVQIDTVGSVVVSTITAKNRGADGNNLRINLKTGSITGTYTLEVYREAVPGTTSAVSADLLLERYENILFSSATDSSFAATVINPVSFYITLSTGAVSGTPVTTLYPMTTGSDGAAVVSSDFTSYAATTTTVWNRFAALTRPLVMFIPNINQFLASGQVAVVNDAISWANSNNGFFVAETPAGETVDAAITYAQSLTDSSHASIYFPNIYIADPVGRTGSTRLVGPSGSVAGLYLNTDATRGVFKAPAGLTAGLNGVIAVESTFSSADLDNLNVGVPAAGTGTPAPVNVIRQLPGAGVVVMGGRTLLQDGTANRYVNMRRSLIFIEQSLNNMLRSVLFENNDEKLWGQINTQVGAFLNQFRNQGGLRGTTPAQSFYVLCNATNNTASSIQSGIVNVQVGVALEYPAEFVVINLSQIAQA